MNKVVVVAVALILGGGVYWYAIQTSTPDMVDTTQDFTTLASNSSTNVRTTQPTPTPSVPKNTESTSQTEQTTTQDIQPAAYVVSEIGISLGTVNGWNCQKRQSHVAHPNWIQLTCYAGQAGMGDPAMALNNAPVDDSEVFSVVSTQNVAIDGRIAKETIYRSSSASSDYGVVEYLFTDVTPEKSFEIIFPYGTGKPHVSASAAAAIGRTIVASIMFN